MTVENSMVPQGKSGEIPDGIKQIISPQNNPSNSIHTVAYSEQFTGPMPHPRIFREYGEVLKDAPERILRMAEKQQAHRMDIEKKVINSDIDRADRGLNLGFVLCLVLIVGSLVLIAIGKDIQGFGVLGAGVVAGVVNFIKVGRERAKAVQNQPKPAQPTPQKTSTTPQIKDALPQPAGSKKTKKRRRR